MLRTRIKVIPHKVCKLYPQRTEMLDSKWSQCDSIRDYFLNRINQIEHCMEISELEISAKPRADLTVEYIDEDLVVLDKKLGRIHQFNSTASIVWKGIAAGNSWRTIAASLVERFDVSTDIAKQDVEKLVDQFRTLKLLESER